YGQEPLLVIGVLTGTILFFADLVRRLNGPIEMDFIGISSYRDGTTSGEINITGANKTDLKDRRVLVVDDILDGGQTLSTVIRELSAQQPKELKTCVLLEKKERRQVPINADYVGFHIPNYFVVGFGLDYAERYRNLPYVGVLDEDQL
ncbi:hypoxanthine phosphoribosyltransferase, partial [Verrucomicrobia bacterium]|nr:hypoxanthine phosphoribosyltransferase [Verrucomicrobiota bacterium]